MEKRLQASRGFEELKGGSTWNGSSYRDKSLMKEIQLTTSYSCSSQPNLSDNVAGNVRCDLISQARGSVKLTKLDGTTVISLFELVLCGALHRDFCNQKSTERCTR